MNVWLKNHESSAVFREDLPRNNDGNDTADDDYGGVDGWSVEEVPGSHSDYDLGNDHDDDHDDDDDGFVPSIFPRSDQRFMFLKLPEIPVPEQRSPMESLRAYLRCRDDAEKPVPSNSPMSLFRVWFDGNRQVANAIAKVASIEANDAAKSRVPVYARHNFDEDHELEKESDESNQVTLSSMDSGSDEVFSQTYTLKQQRRLIDAGDKKPRKSSLRRNEQQQQESENSVNSTLSGIQASDPAETRGMKFTDMWVELRQPGLSILTRFILWQEDRVPFHLML